MVKEFGRAKINLTLDILGKREDGYHEVEFIMQTLELADVIELEKISDGVKLSITGNDNLPADENNLAYRAVVAVNKFCNENLGVAINLQKNIPMAAGLAGGSTDAAAVIRGMNQLYNLNLTVEELCEIGARVGSDVPFCIVGGTCLATGRGEKLTRLKDLPKFSVVLAKPHDEVSTAWAYKTYDSHPSSTRVPTAEIINLLNSGAYEEAFFKFRNVFTPIVFDKIPMVGEYIYRMIAANAKAVLMTGSGPTVFALTDNDDNARVIANSIKDKNAQIIITKTFN